MPADQGPAVIPIGRGAFIVITFIIGNSLGDIKYYGTDTRCPLYTHKQKKCPQYTGVCYRKKKRLPHYAFHSGEYQEYCGAQKSAGQGVGESRGCVVAGGGHQNGLLVRTCLHPSLAVGLVLHETEDGLNDISGGDLRALLQMMDDTGLEALQVHAVGG